MSDAISIVDHPLVASRYFFPRYEAFAEPYWVNDIFYWNRETYMQLVEAFLAEA